MIAPPLPPDEPEAPDDPDVIDPEPDPGRPGPSPSPDPIRWPQPQERPSDRTRRVPARRPCPVPGVHRPDPDEIDGH
jgi:hypothetical protein